MAVFEVKVFLCIFIEEEVENRTDLNEEKVTMGTIIRMESFEQKPKV
jgi:hypothetical protein